MQAEAPTARLICASFRLGLRQIHFRGIINVGASHSGTDSKGKNCQLISPPSDGKLLKVFPAVH